MNKPIKMHQQKHNKRQNEKINLAKKVSILLFIGSIICIAKLGLQLSNFSSNLLSNITSYTTNAQIKQPAADSSSKSDWQLILVNRSNPIPDDYSVNLTQLKNNQSVDSRIYPSLQKMFDDMRAKGLIPTISSSYRTAQKQQSLLDEKITAYQREGYSEKEAEALAKEWVAIPGTSEHQLAMAVDITSSDRNTQNPSVIWEWLMDNSYKYGFILRYPEDKTDITGTMYEPWHYRYVGKEAAKEIYEQRICLEEYLE